MRFLTLVCTLFFVMIQSAYLLKAQDQQLSLDYCFQRAQAVSPLSKQSELTITGLSIQQKITRSNYLPQASLNGQATLQSDVTNVPISFPGIEIPQPQKDQYKVTLDLVQTLWDGGLTKSQLNLNEAASQVEDVRYAVDLYALYEQVAMVWYGALLADKQTASLTIIQNDLQARINKITAAVENGTAIKSNILSLEAKLLEVQQQILDAKGKKAIALDVLSQLIEEPINPDVSLNVPTPINQGDKINRPELILFESQKAAVNANESLVKAKNNPKLSLFATGGYGRPGLNFLSDQFDFYAIGGINIKVPLTNYYSGNTAREMQLLEIQEDKISYQEANFLKNLNIRISQQRSEINRLNNNIETDKKMVQLRSQIREVAATQLDNGVITTSDYISELSNEDLARQNLILHEIQLAQAQSSLEILYGK